MKKIADYVQIFDRIRKRVLLIAGMLLGLCAFLTACGGQEDKTVYDDIFADTEQLSILKPENSSPSTLYLGSQFYQGGRVQIWGEWNSDGYKVYLHREDGSRELLAENLSPFDMNRGGWRIDDQKRIFYENLNTITRINEKGEKIFTVALDEDELIMQSCHLPDGRIMARMTTDDFTSKLSEIDPDSGEVTDIVDLPLYIGAFLIAPNEDGVMLLNERGLWAVNLTDGTLDSIISFDGTSYVLENNNHSTESYRVKEDIRLLEDGSAEILWSDGTSEFLRWSSVEEKEILVIRFMFSDTVIGDWMKEQIVKFNKKSNDYYITIDEYDWYEDEWTEFREKTDLAIATGKGADIICYYAVGDACSLMEKGAFADLTPFMQASGIREEEYFPAAFSGWKNDGKIYGMNCMVYLEGLWADKDIVGDSRITDIEELIDCLQDYEGDAVIYPAERILRLFLENSDNLCGMVDLENGTCDFSGELFAKMLDTAKKYERTERNKTFLRAVGTAYYRNFYTFSDSAYWDYLGKVLIGYPFDDGMHTRALNDAMLAINSASANQEGAWEFLNFLLSEEVQNSFALDEASDYAWRNFPVSRKVFDALCDEHRVYHDYDGYERTMNSGYVDFDDLLVTGLNDVREAELRAALEDARSAPIRMLPLVQIVVEEASTYFSGDKSIDEVRDIIENRVQLYLNERN